MGLMDAGMQQAPAEAPAQAQPAGQGGDQNALARVIAAGEKALYTPQTVRAVLDLIRQSPSPEHGLAQATVHLMAELVSKSRNMPQEVKVPAGKELMGRIAELAGAAGLIEDPQAAIKGASQLIAQELMKAAKGGQQRTQQPPQQTPLPQQQAIPAEAA